MFRILVVEDNRTNQLLDRQVLAKLGYAVEIASNGSEALETCVDFDFDLILMDVQMPVLDGYQTTAMLRQRQQLTGGTRTPIIGLSARAMSGDREVALTAGMDDYLTKPLNVNQLQAVLGRWLPDVTHGDGEPRPSQPKPTCWMPPPCADQSARVRKTSGTSTSVNADNFVEGKVT